MADEVLPVRVEVLGPLRLVVDGAEVAVPGPKRRATLALLALAEGRAVAVDHLLDALWPAEVPTTGRAALHSHVSRLRRHLGPAADRLESLDGAYRLALGPDGLDAAVARAGLATARADAAAGPALLDGALALWRGPVLADLLDVPPLAASAVALDDLRRDLRDLRVDLAVAAGRAPEVLTDASDAASARPLDEPAVLRLMRTLAAVGRSPEALRAGYEFRRRLADETGLDPSPALGELERSIAAVPPSGVAHVSGSGVVGPRFVGREAQAAALRRLIESERLVTVVGPGGVGKTRLTLEVARRAGDATVLLLAPVTDGAEIPHALADTLDLRSARGDLLAACAALLGAGPHLLVVDNCEHLLDAVRDVVSRLLRECPALTVLATSREPLGLATEVPSRLAPLPLPAEGDGAGALRNPAVTVFLERAARVRPGFRPGPRELRQVVDIVRRLDGMPLAIELAAGRLGTFGLDDLARRLDRSLDLLSGGRTSVDARHRTLRATVAWSYDLLPAAEQRLFRRLAVFADGFDLATAESLRDSADSDAWTVSRHGEPGPLRGRDDGDPAGALGHLVDASMVDVTFDGGATRYRMLETLRAFGLDRLRDAGEAEDAELRYVDWAARLAAWIDVAASTEREPEADAALRREAANLRAAWRLARRRGAVDPAVTIIVSLYNPVLWRDVTELRDWALELAADPAVVGHRRAAALGAAAGAAAWINGDPDTADRLATEGLAIAVTREDVWSCLTALSLADLSRARFAAGADHPRARTAARPRPAGNTGVAALNATYGGDLDRARELLREMSLTAAAPTEIAFRAYVAGEIDSHAGADVSALRCYDEALDVARRCGSTFIEGIATVGRLAVLARGPRTAEALTGFAEVIAYWERTRNWIQLWTTLRNLADLLDRLGDEDAAALLRAAADAAPDAPAVGSAARSPVPPDAPDRAEALAIARRAIAKAAPRPAG